MHTYILAHTIPYSKLYIPEKNSIFMKFTGIFGCRPMLSKQDIGYMFMNLPTMIAMKAMQMKLTFHLW